MKIVKGKQRAATETVIYGVEGIGKTTLAAQWPAPLFLDTEGGTGQLDVDRVACDDWDTLRGSVVQLAVESHGYQTVVVDSIDWAEKHLAEWVCRKEKKDSIEAFGFGKGWMFVAEHMGRFLESLNNCRRAGLHVVLIGHSRVQRTSPPDQMDGYDRYELRLSKVVSALVKEWADAVLFCNYRARIVEGEDGRNKGLGGKERIIYAERSAAWDAKNRFGLDEQLPMTIDALAPLFDGTGTKAVDTELYDQVAQYIADAKNVRTLGKIGDRIEQLEADGQLTEEQVAELMGSINQRHEVIEPSKEVADAG